MSGLNFYCGADLEEAVNRTYSRGVRRILPDGGWNQESSIEEVQLTEEDLKRSLIEVPRSIQKESWINSYWILIGIAIGRSRSRFQDDSPRATT